MGVMAVHLILILGAFCVWIHSPTATSSSCSNQTPCTSKGGTCISGTLHCSGKAYKAVRYCVGAGCKCCVGSYGSHSSSHSSEHHSGHGYCNVGRSCGHRGQCKRGSCPHNYRKHAGDCGGGECQCCARIDGDRPDYDASSHHGGRCSGSCGIKGTCRNDCWSDEKLHSGHCGNNCQCCAKRHSWRKRNHWKEVSWRGHSHGYCGGSCGRGKVCRAYHCLSDEYEYGSCSAGYHCKCCKKRQEQMCFHPGINCNHGRGTCHGHHCPLGQVSIGSCSGHSCVCCAHNVGCLRPGAICGVNAYCREGSCFINEYQIGSCGGKSCVCCVQNQLPACYALGASCLGTGFCRVGGCNNNEIQSGTCSGTNCVCCTPYVQQVCTNVNGPCNGHTGRCRSVCFQGEMDMGLGSCSGSTCRCCKFSVCPAAICIKGSQQGECRPNGCQNTEFDVGECIAGQTNCRCCTHQIVTCARVGAICGRSGTCRTSGCLLGEAVHSGDCGGGYCVCCATVSISPVTISGPVITSGVKAACTNPGSLCGSKGYCRQECFSNELKIGLCGAPAKDCVCCEARDTQSQACTNPGSLCGSKGYCRQECFSNELKIGLCGAPAKGCVCCEARESQSQVKRQVNSEELADVAEPVDGTVKKVSATVDTTTDEGVKKQVNSEEPADVAEAAVNIVKKDSATLDTTNDEGDTCPSGYIYVASQCLLFNVKESVNWNTAEQICGHLRGNLVNVLDPHALSTFIKANYGKNYFWLGARDSPHEASYFEENQQRNEAVVQTTSTSNLGTWRWTNGNILDKNFPWSQINHLNSQDCLGWLAKMQGYQDTDCGNSLNFICEATIGGNIEYKKSIGQVTYVDECKKIDVMNVIQLICTRRQLPLRSGKALALDYLEDDHLHSSEEYGEYSNNESFANDEIEYYDSEEENMIKKEFLDDLDDLDYQHNGPFTLENALIHERENANLIKDNATILPTSDNDKKNIAQEPSKAQEQSIIQGENTPIQTDNNLNENSKFVNRENEEMLINDRTGKPEHPHGQS